MRVRDTIAGLGLIIAIAFPGLAAAHDIDAKREEMRAHLKFCTQKYGYDPKRTRGFDEHEIAPGEAKWRDCAYDGIRKIMMPNSAVPSAYQTLIALDRVMTREIQAGEKTRAEREKRIQKFIDDTIAKEKTKSNQAAGQEKKKEQEELDQMRVELITRMNEIKRMREFQTTFR